MNNCERCKEWQRLGLSRTCPSCDIEYFEQLEVEVECCQCGNGMTIERTNDYKDYEYYCAPCREQNDRYPKVTDYSEDE